MRYHARIFMVAAAFVPPALAQSATAEPCAVCARAVVTNSELATCFLSEYDRFAGKTGDAVVVDLTDCETSRGIVEPLPGLTAIVQAPDLQFMVSRGQLECLKRKLEQPDLPLDPSARIELANGC